MKELLEAARSFLVLLTVYFSPFVFCSQLAKVVNISITALVFAGCGELDQTVASEMWA